MTQSDSPDFAYTPLITRLSYYFGVPSKDMSALDELPYEARSYDRGDVIMERGKSVTSFILVTSGWAARTRYTRAGQRQIINILLPGDLMTPDAFVLERIDHAIEALSPVSLRMVSEKNLQALFAKAPGLAPALWWASSQEDAIVREHVVRLGRRNALERVSHFLLEMHRRLLIVHQADENAMILPITQAEISDALGLSVVHVNKTISRLDGYGLIRRTKTLIEILNVEDLISLCDYDMLYLHLKHEAETD